MENPAGPILDAAQRGEPGALTEIVALIQPHVWRFVASLERNRETAEDLAQEALLRVVRGLPDFRRDSSLLTWSLAVARNVVRDHQRAVSRRPRLVDDRDTTGAPRRGEGASIDPDTSLMVDLENAIASLPHPLREVFVLVEIAELQYREVAEVTGIAEGTVKSRMFHARRELIRLLDVGEGDGHG